MTIFKKNGLKISPIMHDLGEGDTLIPHKNGLLEVIADSNFKE